jgi:lipoprotein-releasing system permease protein
LSGPLSQDWRIWVAARYTRAGAGDQLTSFTALISGAGLILGVAILVIVMSVMNGFERELHQRVLGVLPHGVIYTPDRSIDKQLLRERILTHPGVTAIAPILEGSGLLVANGEMAGISVAGIDPVAEKDVSILSQFFISGSFDRIGDSRFNMLIGKRLADSLGVSVGEKVTFVLPDIRITLAGPLPVTRRFDVVGIFESGSDADKSQAYVTLSALRRLQKGNGTEGLRLLTTDLFAAQAIVRELVLTSDQRIYGASWLRRHGNLHGAILMQKRTMFLMLMLLVAVAAFNVVSNLMMVVKEKAQDIAIIRTVGASSSSVRLIFIFHGLLVGFVGISVGLLVGVVLSLVIGDIVGGIDRLLNMGLMDEYFIQYLPVDVRFGDLALIAGSSMLICLVATIYPAGRAAKARPVEALQYES